METQEKMVRVTGDLQHRKQKAEGGRTLGPGTEACLMGGGAQKTQPLIA